MTFKSEWWTAEVPGGWSASLDAQCVTLRDDPEVGSLQISAAEKEREDVSDEDLLEFVSEGIGEDHAAKIVQLGPFTGFTAESAGQGFSCREWWLRLGRLMVYATYNVPMGLETKDEDRAVHRVLSSLRPNHSR